MNDTLKADLQAVADKDQTSFTVTQEVLVTTEETTAFTPNPQ